MLLRLGGVLPPPEGGLAAAGVRGDEARRVQQLVAAACRRSARQTGSDEQDEGGSFCVEAATLCTCRRAAAAGGDLDMQRRLRSWQLEQPSVGSVRSSAEQPGSPALARGAAAAPPHFTAVPHPRRPPLPCSPRAAALRPSSPTPPSASARVCS